MKKPISITLAQEIITEVDNLAGLASRSAFLEMLVQVGLEVYKVANGSLKEPLETTILKVIELTKTQIVAPQFTKTALPTTVKGD